MDATKLPQWKCHKLVRAAAIEKIEMTVVALDEVITLHLAGTTETWSARSDHAIFSRYKPQLGDYLVVYEDGYTSLSPAKAFEEGYTRIEVHTQLNDGGFEGSHG